MTEIAEVILAEISHKYFFPLFISRGVKIASKIPNRILQKECAEILETMKVCEMISLI